MSFVTCSCGTRNSAFNPRCIACGKPVAEIPSTLAASQPPRATPRGQGAPLPGTRFGSWVVRSAIGRGASGHTVLADHVTTGEMAALKILSEEGATTSPSGRRFLREARVLRRVEHPHLARILDVSDTDERPWMALEYLDGPSLEEHTKERALERRHALHVLSQIADALSAVHAAGIVHRDVKPANVVLLALQPDVDARLVDLGLARSFDQPLDSLRTETGVVIGSLAYAAPEVVVGEMAAPASDVWALGVMAFELFVGRLPFAAPTRAELAAAIVAGAIPLCDGPGSATVAAMLDRRLDHRPSSASDVARAFVAAAAAL